MSILLASVFVLTLIALIVVVIVYIFVISKPRTALPPLPPSPSLPPPVSWSENTRNHPSFGYFPPCYSKDPYSKTIYGTISRLKLVQRYFTLLDVMSIILCLEEEQSVKCMPTNVKDRLIQIVGMGGDVNDADTRQLVMSFIKVDDSEVCKFLLGALNIIERQSKIMKVDSSIPRQDLDQILGNIYSFYSSHLAAIYKLSIC